MILADTSIIIDFWRNPDSEKRQIFENHEIAICPVIKAELIHGAKSEKEKRNIKEALNGLTFLTIDEEIWESLAEYLYRLKKSGVTVPFQDALIAAVCIKYDCPLWTLDKHFSKISEHLEDLQLFNPFKAEPEQ